MFFSSGVMSWKTDMWYFVLMVTLMSIELCNGQAAVWAVPQRNTGSPSPLFWTEKGSIHFSGMESNFKHEPAAQTRSGSLAFRFDDQKPTSVLHSSIDAKLKRMDPSVQCGDNLMTLKVKRTRAPHFLVDSGEGPLTPLAQMPSNCGFSVRRSRRDVLYSAPYDGCHVTQQGGNYELPLRISGAPMTMSCPAVALPPCVTCSPSGMMLKIDFITANTIKFDDVKIKVSGEWELVSSVWRSCGLGVAVVTGGLKFTGPYHTGSCIEMEDEVYSLRLLLEESEILLTCPKPTPAPNGGLFPQLPIVPYY